MSMDLDRPLDEMYVQPLPARWERPRLTKAGVQQDLGEAQEPQGSRSEPTWWQGIRRRRRSSVRDSPPRHPRCFSYRPSRDAAPIAAVVVVVATVPPPLARNPPPSPVP